MCLNHSEIILPPLVYGKIVKTKRLGTSVLEYGEWAGSTAFQREAGVLERRLKSSGGGWVISEGPGVLQRQLKSFMGWTGIFQRWVRIVVEMVYGLGGCQRTPSARSLQSNDSGVPGSPVSCSLLPRRVITLQFSHTQSLSVASKVMLVTKALGSNIQCCLQVGGTKEKPVLM